MNFHRPIRICVIDGQSGAIGATLVKYLKSEFEEEVVLIALGTNIIATAQMLKAGANQGASGENAVCRTVMDADFIVGSIAISWPGAMMGEITLKMAEAVISSPARKLLIPKFQESVQIVGIHREPLPHLAQEVVENIREAIKDV